MEDAFKQQKAGDLQLNVVNPEQQLTEVNLKRTDVRYDRPLTKVTKAEHVSKYETKSWPMLNDIELTKTNALGLPADLYSLKQEAKARAQEEAQRLAEQQAEAERLAAIEAEEAAKPKVTVEALEQIRQEAYEEGKQEGLKAGHDEGYAQGYDEGKQQGFDQGQEEGTVRGYGDGFIKGREEGFQKGHKEGIDGGESIVLAQVERFRHLADSLANPLRHVDADVTDELLYIISRLTKVIIKRELKEDKDFIKHSIEQALTILPNYEKGASITLNADDAALVEASLGKEYMESAHWDIKVSDDLQQGDVLVSNDASQVSWRVDNRIDALLNDFLNKSSECVKDVLHEQIEGSPNYDEIPKKPLAPPPTLNDFKDVIKQNLDGMECDGTADAVADDTAVDESAEPVAPATAQAQPQA